MKDKPLHEYVYGLNPCFEVLRGGRRTVKEAFISKDTYGSTRTKKLISLLNSRDVKVTVVDKNRLFQLSKTRDHQGSVLKCSSYPYVRFESLLNSKRLLLLDNVEDPHNVGAIIRSAEIFGFDSIILPLKGVPDVYPSVIKVSAGATEHLNIAKDSNSTTYVKRAKNEGYKILSLDGSGTSDIRDFSAKELPEKFMLVIGGEGKAIGQYILNISDYIVSIKQHGSINSLNASVAAGIAMFTLGKGTL